jgi:Kef-type K+ transport system membrane component KefB
MSNQEISVRFFLQLAVILGGVRLMGAAARSIGQPQVVGEMIAGVLLGPSLLGWAAPGFHAWLMPQTLKPVLFAISQVGLVLYMFVVGMEFDADLVRRRLRSAVCVSAAGMFLPFLLGGVLGLTVAGNSNLFHRGIASWEASLFVGAAMCITAFPMLARIIYERGLARTSLGTLALAAGAIDDVAAWCLLALVIASFVGNPAMVLPTIGGGVLYAVVTLGPLKALLRRMDAARSGGPRLGFVLMLLMLGAWFTDSIRLYAVFGAFIMGTAMPQGAFRRDLQERIEPLTTNFLLPLFFIFSGLNTKLGLIVTPQLWILTAAVVASACVGKAVGCFVAARCTGEDQGSAMAIGTLMNARGLMELILLNIGLERGIITPAFFTVMVIMALATTLMTAPVFERVSRSFLRSQATQSAGVAAEAA